MPGQAGGELRYMGREVTSGSAALLFIANVPELAGLPPEARAEAVEAIAALYEAAKGDAVSLGEGMSAPPSSLDATFEDGSRRFAVVTATRQTGGIECSAMWLNEEEFREQFPDEILDE